MSSPVAIRRLNCVRASAKGKGVSHSELANALGNISRLGYWLNEDVTSALLEHGDVKDLVRIIDNLKVIKGDNASYTPMYPNFPTQVKKADDFELYVNAMMHYIGNAFGLHIMPAYDVKSRKQLKEKVEVTVLGLASKQDMRDVLARLASQGQPFSDQDKKDVELLRKFATTSLFRDVKIGVRENLVNLDMILGNRVDFSDRYENVTDVLRLAAGLSNGDISLADNTRFKLTRAERRRIYVLLNTILTKDANKEQDLVMHTEAWKRLSRTLHIRELGSDTDAAVVALDRLAKGKVVGFNSLVENAVATFSLGDTNSLNVLKARPGVFARRVAELDRKSDSDAVVKAFGEIAPEVSTNVLVSMYNRFNGPVFKDANYVPVRGKSRSSSTGMIRNTYLKRNSKMVTAIKRGLTSKNTGEKVFIKNGEGVAVPMGLRSASSGMRQIGRGSRIPMEDKSTVRLFMHWRNIDKDGYYGNVDLDISATLWNEDFSDTQSVWYGNLRSKGLKAYHSGDITSAPHGAAEFIDIDVESALKSGMRYVTLSVISYSGQKLSDVPEAWAGVMMREKPKSGEIFEPSTVTHRYDLTAQSRSSVPLIFDLKTKEMIWLDANVRMSAYSNVVSNEGFGSLVLHAVKSHNLTVPELASLVRDVVHEEKDADVVIDATQTDQVLSLLQ